MQHGLLLARRMLAHQPRHQADHHDHRRRADRPYGAGRAGGHEVFFSYPPVAETVEAHPGRGRPLHQGRDHASTPSCSTPTGHCRASSSRCRSSTGAGPSSPIPRTSATTSSSTSSSTVGAAARVLQAHQPDPGLRDRAAQVAGPGVRGLPRGPGGRAQAPVCGAGRTAGLSLHPSHSASTLWLDAEREISTVTRCDEKSDNPWAPPCAVRGDRG